MFNIAKKIGWETFWDSVKFTWDSTFVDALGPRDAIEIKPKSNTGIHRPLAGYGLPPPRGNFVDHIFLEAQCLARILQHVSPLTMAALGCNTLLHTLPYKIFDN